VSSIPLTGAPDIIKILKYLYAECYNEKYLFQESSLAQVMQTSDGNCF